LKSVIVVLLVLFFVITPVHAQLLSDATGLVNNFEIQTSGYNFEIKLISNFDLKDYVFEKDQKQLTLFFESNLNNNLAEIIIPKNFSSSNCTG